MLNNMKDLWEQVLDSTDITQIDANTARVVVCPTLCTKTNIDLVLCPICNRTICKLSYEDMTEHNRFHMIEILPGLLLGAKGNAYNPTEMHHFGITHIINAAYEVQNKFINTIEYKNFLWRDDEDFDILQDLDIATNYIHQLLTNNKHVFVHCYAGRSRSASIIIAYLIKYHKKTYNEAYKFVKDKKDDVSPNPGFIEQLKNYEKMTHKI